MFNYSDLAGGAAIAAYRTHQSLRRVGIDSTMWVNKKLSDDWTVKASPSGRLISRLRAFCGTRLPELFFRDSEKAYRSYNWIPSGWVRKLNQSDADLVHLQWVNAESLSIRDVAQIRKPMILTMQDMWAFCGGEHYTHDERWKSGYSKASRPSTIKGLDVDRLVWLSKQKHWKEPFQLVAISEWLADCVKQSTLLGDWPLAVIPNPVDTQFWKPLDKQVARSAFNLPDDRKIVLFGALGGTSNPRKGYAHLDAALKKISQQRDDIHLVVYGQSEPQQAAPAHFPTTYVGRLSDPAAMCLLNNAADVFVNPAIQEAFGQTASEAHACGLPVVAFRGTGIADIVDHQRTGYLAELEQAEELARGILWVLERVGTETAADEGSLSANARKRAIDTFSYEVVGQQYAELYEQVLGR